MAIVIAMMDERLHNGMNRDDHWSMEWGRMLKRVVHPGVVLAGELEELGVSRAEFARQIGTPANRVSRIIAGKRSVRAETALRFGHWFGVEPQFWMNLQRQFDLAMNERDLEEA